MSSPSRKSSYLLFSFGYMAKEECKDTHDADFKLVPTRARISVDLLLLIELHIFNLNLLDESEAEWHK